MHQKLSCLFKDRAELAQFTEAIEALEYAYIHQFSAKKTKKELNKCSNPAVIETIVRRLPEVHFAPFKAVCRAIDEDDLAEIKMRFYEKEALEDGDLNKRLLKEEYNPLRTLFMICSEEFGFCSEENLYAFEWNLEFDFDCNWDA